MWYQENSIEFLFDCAIDFILFYIVCVLLSYRYSNDLFYDPITLSYQNIKDLIYSSRYRSAGPSSKSKLKSKSSSTTSTILGVPFYSKYKSYTSSIRSSQFMTSVMR